MGHVGKTGQCRCREWETFELLKKQSLQKLRTRKYNLPVWLLGVGFPSGVNIFVSFKMSRAALGPTHPPIQWVFFRAVNWPGQWFSRPSPASTEVKDKCSYTSQFCFPCKPSRLRHELHLHNFILKWNPSFYTIPKDKKIYSLQLQIQFVKKTHLFIKSETTVSSV